VPSILFNGVMMFNKALADVMDTAVSAEFENEVRAVALRVPGVSALDKCRVRKSGLSHLVDIQVRVDGEMSVAPAMTSPTRSRTRCWLRRHTRSAMCRCTSSR